MKWRQAERRQRRKANKWVSSESKASFSDKVEDKDLPSISSSLGESESNDDEEIPQQPDLEEELESQPPFWIWRPVIHSASKVSNGPTAQSKMKALKTKTSGLGSSSCKKPMQ